MDKYKQIFILFKIGEHHFDSYEFSASDETIKTIEDALFPAMVMKETVQETPQRMVIKGEAPEWLIVSNLEQTQRFVMRPKDIVSMRISEYTL